jgi:hypothetical protein
VQLTHLEDTGESEHQPPSRTNQEHRRDVQPERDRRVGDHDERPDAEGFAERRESLGEGEEAGVDDGADLPGQVSAEA